MNSSIKAWQSVNIIFFVCIIIIMATRRDDWRSIDPHSLRGMRKEDMTVQQRMAVANREMEESSKSCVRILHQTMDLADNTTKELYRQSEALDRTEAHLDGIDVDLEQSRRNMREIKSVWGGLVNNITKPKFSKETKGRPSPLPPDRRGQKRGPSQAQAESTGNEIVDRNLDELEKGLHMLEGQSRIIGHQLDESNVQIDRLRKKVDKSNNRLKNVTGDINGELH